MRLSVPFWIAVSVGFAAEPGNLFIGEIVEYGFHPLTGEA